MSSPRVESPYDGPEGLVTVVAGGRSIVLARPSDPDRLLDHPEVRAWNATEDYMPYWAYLWPGAFLLADAVGRGTWPDGTAALEIGCGLGLAGLVGVARGLRVHFTDVDRTPLRFVERSASANGFDPSRYSTGRLDWREPPPEQYALILGSDVTYERKLVPLVAGLLAAMLADDGEALLSDPDRASTRDLGQVLADFGLGHEAIPAEADGGELGPVRGAIHRIWRRQD